MTDVHPGSPFTLCFLNRKGGVGKTSCCHHLGGTFAEDGYRTLLVDMDPQGSLTQGLLGVKQAMKLSPRETVAGLFAEHLDPTPEDILRPTRFDRLTLAPCSVALNDYNLPQPETQPLAWQHALDHFLREVRGRYDIILIDCPPNLNLCSWNALLASHHVVVPLQPEDYGAQGIVHVQKLVEQARERANPRLTLLGYLLTLCGRLSIQKAYQEQIRQLYGEDVFQAEVPFLKDFKEAISYGMPVAQYAPGAKAALAVRAVADELLRRVQQHHAEALPLSRSTAS